MFLLCYLNVPSRLPDGSLNVACKVVEEVKALQSEMEGVKAERQKEKEQVNAS
jgi:cell division protein FtsB